MKVLVTGAGGFIGKNLVADLKTVADWQVEEYHHTDKKDRLVSMIKSCDFICHLAGVNRPQNVHEFQNANVDFTKRIIDILNDFGKSVPILLASSIQAGLDNPYGQSKKKAEDIVRNYGITTGAKIYIYRLPGVFGKWCKPEYNSVVATFSHHIANGLPIHIESAERQINLVYIDDVITEFKLAMKDEAHWKKEFCVIPVVYKCSLGRLAELLIGFKDCRKTLEIPDLTNSFIKKLYSTYLTYLPDSDFLHDLVMHGDSRGSFTEFIRTQGQGQFSVNISHPNIIKGNHWHHSKHEKFLVVRGKGVIRLRRIDSTEIIVYPVSGEKMQVVDIPPGYTHNIENTGDIDMVTVMWANECFDSKHPDTFYMEV